MPRTKRIKTAFTGVYYLAGRATPTGRKERHYYIRYRKNGSLYEEKAGARIKDGMTPAKAAKIRAEIISGKRPTREEVRLKQLAARHGEPKNILPVGMEKVVRREKELEEKWLLFTESATDSFCLLDSKLNLVECNDATVQLYPPGTRKEDIIGKNLLQLVPEIKTRGEYKMFLNVIKTGIPIIEADVVPPPVFRGRLFKYKAFKVGDGLGIIISDITVHKKREEELNKSKAELTAKNRRLEELNTALKVLLEKREEDKKELERNTVTTVRSLVGPYIEKLKKTNLDDRQSVYVDIVESNLNDIVSTFMHKMSGKHLGLTHMEIQVANLIKAGRVTKEIAEILHLSLSTIQSYRKSIRKKLGLKNKKVNLRTYLSSLGNEVK